eukprot:m.91720 g.91720  ORF g.91720 m.91720 type:complete len:710 (+) comp15305_c0_seq1:340-2469(+)
MFEHTAWIASRVVYARTLIRTAGACARSVVGVLRLLLLVPHLDELLHDARIGQGGNVAKLVLAEGGNLAKNAPHDLARAGLWQAGCADDDVGLGKGSNVLADHALELLRKVGGEGEARLKDDIGMDGLALDVVRDRDDGCLHHSAVARQRGLQLSRTDTVARDVHHVIRAAGDPEVAVGVTAATVAGKVVRLELREVCALEPLMVAIDGAHLSRPGVLEHKVAGALALNLHTLLVDHGGHNAKHREARRARLHRGGARQAGKHVAARLRLPPRVNNGAALAANDLVVPLPGLRVDRLADGAEDAEGGEIALLRVRVAEALQGADGGRRSVEEGDVVLLDNLPEARAVGVCWHALEDDARGAVGKRSVGDVAVACDPANVGRAKVNVLGLVVECEAVGGGCPYHVSAGGVQHALGLAGGAAGVQEEERVLGVDPLHGADGVRRLLLVGKDKVPARLELCGVVHLLAEVEGHDARLHIKVGVLAAGHGVLGNVPEVDLLVAAHDAICDDQHAGLGVGNAVCERLAGEAAEDDRVGCADAGAGEHGHDQLHDHGHVDGHAVATLHAVLLEDVGKALHAREQIAVGRGAVHERIVALPVEGDAVAVASLNVAIQRIVADVCQRALEPADGNWPVVDVEVAEVELVPRLLPVEALGNLAPELLRLVDGLAVHGRILAHGLDVGCGRQLLWRRNRVRVGRRMVVRVVLMVERLHG